MSKYKRCEWPGEKGLMIEYHDREWGVPVHDDRKLFEFMVLDVFQAGLSWSTILNKRDNFRKAFSNFNYELIAKYDERKIESLMGDAGIIRNKQKIIAAVTNAQKFREVRKEFGTFDNYLWSFVNLKPKMNNWKKMSDIPAKTELSEKISIDLKKRGFKFVGPTIIYAFLQAAGLVNDHITSCYRYSEIKNMK